MKFSKLLKKKQKSELGFKQTNSEDESAETKAKSDLKIGIEVEKTNQTVEENNAAESEIGE